ncbi:MAG TPA: FG-GAP-like repeat-containing protein, partial [Mycobacteriales bacterium]|nr:FG-GAP-like repeat-containing protein [Mycobacteriales bacterium]
MQGLPFEFKATVASSQALAAKVVFSLLSPSGSSVAFDSSFAVVAPGASTEVRSSVTASQFFPQAGAYKIQATIEGQTVGVPLTFQVRPQTALRVPKFVDVTAATGTGAVLPSQTCNHWSNGAAWADVNHDGRLDLFVTRGTAGTSQLYIQGANRKFTEEAAARGAQLAGFIAQGAAFADYDNDGDPDLAVVGDGTTHLLRNDGTGHFEDVSAQTGVGKTPRYDGMSVSWGDYDNDGRLDFYVANHSESTCSAGRFSLGNLIYHPDQLYHQNADGTFTEVSSLLGGAAATSGPGFQAAW